MGPKGINASNVRCIPKLGQVKYLRQFINSSESFTTLNTPDRKERAKQFFHFLAFCFAIFVGFDILCKSYNSVTYGHYIIGTLHAICVY